MAPPPGFTYAGQLYATDPGGPPWDTKAPRSLNFPVNIRLDRTYQQTGPMVTSGGGAQSNLVAGDIPKGIYIECKGSDTDGRRWAVLKPYDGSNILKAASVNDDDTVGQYSFTLGLYADRGNGVAQFGQEGAETTVTVWFKARQ